MGPTDKQAADDLAIGGMKDTAASVARLSYSHQSGAKLGGALKAQLGSKVDWVRQTCDLMGTKLPDAKPPPEAVAAVRSVICEHVGHVPPTDHERLTKIDAHLLESWRTAAEDPETQAANWCITGSPTGILHQPSGPGIFPDVACPAELRPEDLSADHITFRNSPGVEEHITTETEITGHMHLQHLEAF